MVWEKIKQFGSKWVLENSERKLIAFIKGNRKEKNYEVLSQKNQIVARCYRNPEMSIDSYKVDILESNLDTFLILSYIIVLDRVKRYPIISYSG